jgi:4-carboxymuconolactone decarboxylase
MTDTLWTRRRATQLPLIALLTGDDVMAEPATPNSRGYPMPDSLAPRRSPFADIAPALANYTDNVLFGDVWKRPELSPRDRSLVTVACLIAQYRINEMPFHIKFALANGVTREELIEAITHLAFYAGWPTASTAIGIARRVFDEQGK